MRIDKNLYLLDTYRDIENEIFSETKTISRSDKSNKGVFENFFNSIEDGETDKELILSQYLNKGNITPNDIKDIEITTELLKNNQSKISKRLQYKISQVIIKKLYDKCRNNIGFMDSFLNDFGSIENINKTKIDLPTLTNKLEGYRNDIVITNQDIFNAFTNIYPYKKFNEQTPSNQRLIGELLDIEYQSIIDNFHSRSPERYKTMQNILMPNGNISKNIDTKSVSNEKIEKLKEEKYKLEHQGIITPEIKREISDKNKQIWEEYIAYLDQNEKTKKIANILKKLIENHFNFEALDTDEKTYIAQYNLIQNINQSEIPINLNEYQTFLQDLYDFSKTYLTINLGGEDLKLNIEKHFEIGEHNKFQDIENLDELPLSFTINLDSNSPETIALLEDPENIILSREASTNGVISSYTTKNGTMRIGNDYLLDIGGVQINAKDLDVLLNSEPEDLIGNLTKYNLYYQFSIGNYDYDFSKFLANSEVKILKRNLKFNGKTTNKISQLYLFNKLNSPQELKENDSVGENLVNGAQREASENEQKAKDCAQELYNSLLETFRINENEDENDNEPPYAYDEDEIDRKMTELYYDLDDEGKQAFKREFRELCETGQELGTYGVEIADRILGSLEEYDPNTTQPTEIIEERADTPEKAFEKEWKKFKGSDDCKFEEGTRLYFKKGESELPPDDISDSFFVFEICHIEGRPGAGTFGVKAIGSEVPLECPGKIYDNLPYTAEQLSNMLKSSSNIYKMPERKDTSRIGCVNRVQGSTALEKGFTSFGEMEGQGQIKLKGKKFVDKNGNEIKYFNRIQDDIEIEKDENGENKKAKQGKLLAKYEIKSVDTNRGTVKIASTFDGVDRSKPNDIKNVKYKYEHELTFEQFILFVETKKLKGYTQEKQNIIDNKYNIEEKDRLPGRGMWRRVSIGNFVSIFKNSGKKIKELYKERQKDQEEHLENFLFSDEGLHLYKNVGKIMSLGGLLGDIQTAFDDADLEFYNNRDERIWKKIDYWYKKFSSDPVYAAEYGSRLKDILLRKHDIYRGGDKDRYKFAAAVLIMLKKEGPYPRDLKDKLGDGYWVESFLGEGHKKRFMEDFYLPRKQELTEIKDMGYSSSVRMDRMEELNKMEFQYIISVIDGAAPYASPDENAQKSIRSGKFKDELQTNLDSYFNKHEEEKNKLNTFVSAEEAYLRTLGAGRFSKALPALERMCEKACTPGEIFRLKGYIISAMLMGCIDYSSSASTMKSFWKTARSMGFSPLCRVRDPNHPEKIERLLNGISEGDSKIQNFTDTTKFNLTDFTPPGIKGDYGKVNANILAYWEINGKQILKYIENPTYYDKESSRPENSISAKAKAKEYPNREIFGDIVKFHNDDDPGNINPNVNSINFIKVAPLTAKGNIMKKYMPTGGVYKTEKEEDITDAKDARNAIAKEITQATTNNVEFYLKYFFNVFVDKVDKSELARTIALIEELKKRNCETEAKYIRRYLFTGNMHKNRQGSFPDEFKHCFESFSNLFYDSIGTTIDNKVIKSAFGAEYVNDYQKPYKMVNRSQWNAQMGGDDTYNHSGGAFANNLRNLGYYQEDTINYKIKELKKAIKRQGVSFKKIPESFSTSTINLNFIYDEENSIYRTRENSIPIPTTKQQAA